MLASTALHSENQPALRNPAAFGCLGWTFLDPPVRRGNDSLDRFLIPPHSQRTVQYACEHFPSHALYPRHFHPLATATDEISGLGDCQKIKYRIAPDFCLASRRDSSYISRYAPAGATSKPSKKTSKMAFSLTDIALEHV